MSKGTSNDQVDVIIDSRPLSGKAGKTIRLSPARVVNDQKVGKKYLGVGYRVSGGGEVDNFGNVRLPIKYGTDTDITAIVYANYDPNTFVEIPIHVEALHIQIVVAVIPELRSEQQIPLLNYITVKDDVEKKGITLVCNEVEIDSNGVLKTPKVTGERLELEVVATSKADTSVSEVFTVPINPVEIAVGNRPTVIRADGKKTNFEITTRNDPRGNKNFSVQLDPEIGEMSKSGIFTSPKLTDKPERVKLAVVSSYDDTKEETIEFELRPPLCPSCGEEVNENGICPVCGDDTFANKAFDSCPECHKPLRNGKCKSCGFPNPCGRIIV